jgi:hypothetical protein
MQQATRSTQPSMRESRYCTVRLVRGSSRQAPSWLLQAGPGGTPLSIGAGARCEWRIRAAGVPDQALWLMLTEHGLYARAAHERTVRVDGKPLPSDWLPIPSAARIDIGMAGLTVSAAEDVELDATDPDQSGMRPTPAPEPAAPRSSLALWRFSRNSLPDAPSVLGRYARPVNKLWLYLVSGLTLVGYGLWVAFLE